MRIYVIPPGEPPVPASVLPRDSLPDTQVGHGNNDIAQAWLALPTRRFSQGVLGDRIEAGELRIRTRDGATLSFLLPEDSVFQDLVPRVYDLDGDGLDEVVLIKSHMRLGSSVIAIGIREGRLVAIAETPATGTAVQWLNPIGVADVDGDGRLELMVVLYPHDGGILIEYVFDGKTFRAGHSVNGVSNHVAGTREQGMAALMDVNGDGIPDVVIPSSDRRSLRAFAFNRDRPLEFTRINLPAPALGNFVVIPPHSLLVPLEDGRRLRIDWR